jgi:outer membrane immunogenic protein
MFNHGVFRNVTMLRLLFILALVTTAAQSARAADVPVKAPAAPIDARAPFSWTGLYLGINGGYAWGSSSWNDPALGLSSGDFGVRGGLVGGQLGYNWQQGPLVLGVETDADWLNGKGGIADGGVCTVAGGGQCRTSQSWIGTTRGRVGYAFGYWMPYITAGAAYGDIQTADALGTQTMTRLGWSAGAGVEVGLLGNWSAKLEFLHLDLGTASFFDAASGGKSLSVPVKDDLVRAGISDHW